MCLVPNQSNDECLFRHRVFLYFRPGFLIQMMNIRLPFMINLMELGEIQVQYIY